MFEKRHLKLVFLAAGAIVSIAVFRPGSTILSGPVKPIAERKSLTHFELSRLEGGSWSLAHQRGKVVLVNFWASWCSPCQREIPALAGIAEEYAARGVAVVGVTLDEGGLEDVRRFVAVHKVTYPILVPGKESGLAEAVSVLPTTFLVDKHGRVAKTYQGAVAGPVFRRDVDRLLAEN